MHEHAVLVKSAIYSPCTFRSISWISTPATLHFTHSQVPPVASDILTLYCTFPTPSLYPDLYPDVLCSPLKVLSVVNIHVDVRAGSKPDRATARTTCFCREPERQTNNHCSVQRDSGQLFSSSLLVLLLVFCLVHGCIGQRFLRVIGGELGRPEVTGMSGESGLLGVVERGT